MKNKIFMRALLITIASFMLYSANLKAIKHKKVKIITPRSSQVISEKQKREPKIAIASTSPKITSSVKIEVEHGSQKSLTKKIENVMGQTSYQISVQDLNNSSKYVRLSTDHAPKGVNNVMKLLLLLGIYKQEKNGKLNAKSTIKIKRSDQVKGEKYLQTNMLYGVAYLRQAMMRGSKTAANALLRKFGTAKLTALAAKFGATQTKITGTFSQVPVGRTTANDLGQILKGLYQGRVLTSQQAQRVLIAMHGQKVELTRNINGTVYAIGDNHAAAAIIQISGHSYCISAWTTSNEKLAKLGIVVNSWFIKNR